MVELRSAVETSANGCEVSLRIKELARRIGVSERVVRHYERAGLLVPARQQNGYRSFVEQDVLKAALIRDMIRLGFSTRELRVFADCFDADARGIPSSRPQKCAQRLQLKLAQIDRSIAALAERRRFVLARLATATARSDVNSTGAGDASQACPMPPARSGANHNRCASVEK